MEEKPESGAGEKTVHEGKPEHEKAHEAKVEHAKASEPKAEKKVQKRKARKTIRAKTKRKRTAAKAKEAPARHRHRAKKFISTNIILTLLLVIAVASAAYMYVKLGEKEGEAGEGATTTTTIASVSQYGTAKLDFYVMSQCPYGTQVEDAVKPVLDKLGNSIVFTLNFIASENADGTFSSMHGQAEVDGDMMQLCAAKHYPDKYMAFIVCQNKNARDIQNNWKTCALENSMDESTLSTCFSGSEGKQLLSASIKASAAANARGSPTMYLNGKAYNGARDSTSFMRALCATLNNHPECVNLPACSTDNDCTAEPAKDGKCVNPGQKDAKCEYSNPVPMDLIVVNSKDCGDSCDTSRILAVTKQLFLGSKVRNVEYSSEEGKQLVEKYGIKILPAYLFSDNITKSPNYAQISRALNKVGDMYQITPSAAGASYNPTLVEIPRKLDLFVMSQCPYGVMAEKNLKEVLDLFGSKINFSLRFIADQKADGTFSSLHGQKEVDEDLRQVCAMKYYPDKYYSYILCIDENYANAASIWEDCAQKNGLDVNTIKTCFEGSEGKQLLTENIKLGNELGIGSSPTFLINGKKQVGGAMPAETIKQNICKANAGLEGCEKTLSGASTGNVPASGAC
jgi:predicted DsbA family dithiol-disulfide isomerase